MVTSKVLTSHFKMFYRMLPLPCQRILNHQPNSGDCCSFWHGVTANRILDMLLNRDLSILRLPAGTCPSLPLPGLFGGNRRAGARRFRRSILEVGLPLALPITR